MNAVPDPAEIAAPRDPAFYASRPLLGPGFWAFVIFGIVCVAAGAALARFGPSWFAPRVPAAVERPVPAAAPAPAARNPLLSGGPPVTVAPSIAPDNLARLEGRVAQLEADQQRGLDAARAALAAATLADVARTARPFPEALSGLDRVLPLSPDLRALARLAQDGAPTRAGLADEFETLAARAAVAARDPGRNADFLARLSHALSSIVSIRQVGITQGSGPDALLGRAQRLLNEGDIEGAMVEIEPLPRPAQAVLASWRAAAERRVEIDRHVAAIRAAALAGLAQVDRAESAKAGPAATATPRVEAPPADPASATLGAP